MMSPNKPVLPTATNRLAHNPLTQSRRQTGSALESHRATLGGGQRIARSGPSSQRTQREVSHATAASGRGRGVSALSGYHYFSLCPAGRHSRCDS